MSKVVCDAWTHLFRSLGKVRSWRTSPESRGFVIFSKLGCSQEVVFQSRPWKIHHLLGVVPLKAHRTMSRHWPANGLFLDVRGAIYIFFKITPVMVMDFFGLPTLRNSVNCLSITESHHLNDWSCIVSAAPLSHLRKHRECGYMRLCLLHLVFATALMSCAISGIVELCTLPISLICLLWGLW